MSFSGRPIPRWANVAGWVWILLVFGFTLYNAIAAHLDFVRVLGYFWIHLGGIMLATVGGGIVLYGVVVLLDMVHGRKPPKREKEEDYSRDIANLVP